MRIKRYLRNSVEFTLRQAGYELAPLGVSAPKLSFIPFKKTLRSAQKLGISVGDYIDRTSNVPGATQQAIDQMQALGIFDRDFQRICEIGPGSGRYLEKIKQKCSSAYYEIYEIEPDWAQWLVETYHVTAQPCDGKSLSSTPSKSVDFVHAHKVFTCIPIMASFQYFNEMARVIKDEGIILFDIINENCLDHDTLEKWFQVGYFYPVMLARQFVIDYFQNLGVHLIGNFYSAIGPGKSEYLIFSSHKVWRDTAIEETMAIPNIGFENMRYPQKRYRFSIYLVECSCSS